MTPRLSVGPCATLACLWEVTVPKPGNVHRGADFEDATFGEFVTAAVAIGPAMETACETGLGKTVLDACLAVQKTVSKNTHLGTILLLAPLAGVPRLTALEAGIDDWLRHTTADDCRMVYEAIRLSNPGGLGRVDNMDILGDPPLDLLAAMRAAAGYDLVARQYAESFQQVLGCAGPWIEAGLAAGWSLSDAVIHAHLRLMSQFPDSLIGRKCGQQIATESADRAAAALDAGGPGDENYMRAVADLDFWLRSDGHLRNPGTTADLIAAGIFVLLRDERLRPPFPPIF